jgi:tRNA pseudouridine32 synthase/23S rRNA pseudouridine746 synthase
LVYEPAPGLPTVVYEDPVLLVVDKPSGLLSVPGRKPEHHDSALLRLQQVYGPLWVVHRLDMDTSGLIAYARSREAAAHLGQQFERRRVHKTYEAWVWGQPPSTAGVIALPLSLDWPHRPRQCVDPLAGKPSVTQYALVAGGNGRSDARPQWVKGEANPSGAQRLSRLRLTPVTGRSHQLRVHLSAIGLPIVGDRFYGRSAEEEPAIHRLMLHAQVLQLRHPADDRCLRLEARAAF